MSGYGYPYAQSQQSPDQYFYAQGSHDRPLPFPSAQPTFAHFPPGFAHAAPQIHYIALPVTQPPNQPYPLMPPTPGYIPTFPYSQEDYDSSLPSILFPQQERRIGPPKNPRSASRPKPEVVQLTNETMCLSPPKHKRIDSTKTSKTCQLCRSLYSHAPPAEFTTEEEMKAHAGVHSRQNQKSQSESMVECFGNLNESVQVTSKGFPPPREETIMGLPFVETKESCADRQDDFKEASQKNPSHLIGDKRSATPLACDDFPAPGRTSTPKSDPPSIAQEMGSAKGDSVPISKTPILKVEDCIVQQNNVGSRQNNDSVDTSGGESVPKKRRAKKGSVVPQRHSKRIQKQARIREATVDDDGPFQTESSSIALDSSDSSSSGISIGNLSSPASDSGPDESFEKKVEEISKDQPDIGPRGSKRTLAPETDPSKESVRKGVRDSVRKSMAPVFKWSEFVGPYPTLMKRLVQQKSIRPCAYPGCLREIAKYSREIEAHTVSHASEIQGGFQCRECKATLRSDTVHAHNALEHGGTSSFIDTRFKLEELLTEYLIICFLPDNKAALDSFEIFWCRKVFPKQKPNAKDRKRTAAKENIDADPKSKVPLRTSSHNTLKYEKDASPECGDDFYCNLRDIQPSHQLLKYEGVKRPVKYIKLMIQLKVWMKDTQEPLKCSLRRKNLAKFFNFEAIEEHIMKEIPESPNGEKEKTIYKCIPCNSDIDESLAHHRMAFHGEDDKLEYLDQRANMEELLINTMKHCFPFLHTNQ